MVKTRSLTVRGKRLDRRNLKKSINLNKKKQMSKKGKNSLKKSSVVEKKNEYEYCCNAAKCAARGMTPACGCMCEDPDYFPGLGLIAYAR